MRDHPKGNTGKDEQIFNNKIKYDGHCALNCYLAQKYFRFLHLTFNFLLAEWATKIQKRKRKHCYERPSTKHAHTHISRIIQVDKLWWWSCAHYTQRYTTSTIITITTAATATVTIINSSTVSFNLGFPHSHCIPFNRFDRFLTIWFRRFFLRIVFCACNRFFFLSSSFHYMWTLVLEWKEFFYQ